ncbi:putative aminoglycoside phosphotransferase, protein kinase-like domain superfamily [Septoria linicola]|nr:putative aminoglycoside phosphotransferase, protein kinase-like domain superfamily [Septoria linicola]
MSAPGKIQTVYTTSKRGRRERLGEWFLRSAQRSRGKRDRELSPAPGRVVRQSMPVVVNSSTHDTPEHDRTSRLLTDRTADDPVAAAVVQEPQAERLVGDCNSIQPCHSMANGQAEPTAEAVVTLPLAMIPEQDASSVVDVASSAQPSASEDDNHHESVPASPGNKAVELNEVEFGEAEVRAGVPIASEPSVGSPETNDVDSEAVDAGSSIAVDTDHQLELEQERSTIASLNGGYARTEASEAETINPYLDNDSELFGGHQSNDAETAYDASHIVSSPLLVASDKAESQEIDEEKYWGPTRDIDEEKIVALLTRVVKKSHGTVNANYRVISKHCGSYNCAYILKSSYTDRICVRVPACGFPDRWNDFDGKLLRESALGMKFIRNKTDLPIPRLIDYDTTMDNEIGAPFIVMSFLSGKPIEEAWPQQEGEDFAVTDARRQTILQSLAKTMRLLEPTVFPRFGALLFDGEEGVPNIGDTSRLTTDDIFVLKRKFKPVAFRSSLEDYVHAAKRKLFRDHQYPEEEHDHLTKGLFMLWELMLERFLEVVKLEHGEPNFVLMQSDFNPQNILVDERGNVTGLIDWDCLEAIPRQVGWCSLPHWLKKDWEPECIWPAPTGTKQILQPHEFDKYRKAYSRYIREACPGKNDSRFTAKSHVYSALLKSGEHLDNVKRFVCNVLGDVLPRLGGTQDVFISQIGEQGYKKDEKEWLEMRLRDFFAPEACHTCQRTSVDEDSTSDEGAA